MFKILDNRLIILDVWINNMFNICYCKYSAVVTFLFLNYQEIIWYQ